jgi:hypothetical protein
MHLMQTFSQPFWMNNLFQLYDVFGYTMYVASICSDTKTNFAAKDSSLRVL